jgi:hypothetical protein
MWLLPLVSTMRKPFDTFAEGLIATNSRGDRRALELFVAGIRGFPEKPCAMVCQARIA